MERDGQLCETDHSSRTFHQRTLCEELWNLRTEGAMCDVILEVAGERLWAHRVILSACSLRFKNFLNKLAPDFPQVIKIDDCSYKVCLRALENLYTGRTVLFSGRLLDEFNCLCERWELKHPVFTHNSSADVALDKCGSKVENIMSDPSKDHATKCQTSASLDNESPESSLSVSMLNDVKPSTTKGSEPGVPVTVSKITRPHKKRTVTSLISDRKKRKKRKVAPIKVELDEQQHQVGNANIEKAGVNVSYNTEPNAELDLATAYNDDTDSSWDDNHDSVKSKQTPTTRIQKRGGKSKRNHGMRVTNKLTNSTRPCSRLDKTKQLGHGGMGSRRYVKKRRKFACRQCDIEFDSRTGLTEHRKEAHKKNINCAQCQLQFPEKNQLLAHNMEHHWTEGIQLPDIYSCMVSGCSFNTHKRMSWYNHRLHAHPSECSICDICGKALKNELTLRQHKTVVHPTSPRKVFSCAACEKVFKTESSLQKHRSVEHRPWSRERDRFVCPYCAHTCLLAESLTEHLYKKHNILTPSKKSYQCHHCDFKTTHVAEIRKHEIRHKPDKDKPFECDKCNKRFVDRGSLASHQLKHNIGANVFKCQYCDYSTKYTHNLRAHVQVRHEKKDHKPWECDACSYRCNSKGNLYKHLRNVHKRTVETKYTVSRIGSDGQGHDADCTEMAETGIHADQSQPTQLPRLVPAKGESEAGRGWQSAHSQLAGDMWTVPALAPGACSVSSGHGEVSGGDSEQQQQQQQQQPDSCGELATSSAGLIQPVPKPYGTGALATQQPVAHYDYMVAMQPVPPHIQPVHHQSHDLLSQLPSAHPTVTPQPQLQPQPPPVQLPSNGDMNTLLYPYPDF